MRVVVAVLTLSIAAPVAAQVYGPVEKPAPRVPTIDSRAPRAETWRETRAIREDVSDGRRSGQLSRQQARGYRKNAAAMEALSERIGVGGVSAAEQRELDARVEVERAQVNAARTRGK